MVALELAEVRGAAAIADLGSGAGLPGLVLAAALPSATVSLVESAKKKCGFIADTAAAMGVANATGVWSRAETWSAGMEACDLVVARALAPMPVLCEYAGPLLHSGGSFVAWKGAMPDEERADGLAAAQIVGLEHVREVQVTPFPGSRRRTLQVFRKIAPTPERFPRREGMALKRPLSVSDLP
jgi:16S rRNA (guanine527-N7)-methyltransferase